MLEIRFYISFLLRFLIDYSITLKESWSLFKNVDSWSVPLSSCRLIAACEHFDALSLFKFRKCVFIIRLVIRSKIYPRDPSAIFRLNVKVFYAMWWYHLNLRFLLMNFIFICTGLFQTQLNLTSFLSLAQIILK